ncbi:uncharacterized protein I206_103880 [Kwoniella pini CBS 10737]|uniref:Uncharacterized protein n=1 Tax=Kwoniella pini CBS 10737 TaxID=1296096 RepID=A0A1B9I383_9TREE|nr:uncharacterized protein I206_04547 [Kwoniella pini CBS 10737]OCF50016.1 hypothetical protein I206_04547 [Kwoniella pini CBS 10737]
MLSFGLFLALIPLIYRVKAQDQASNGTSPAEGQNGAPDLSQYPQWITNDYQCVIGCLSGFNDTITIIPQPDLENAAFTCASTNCAGDGTGNYYQTLYYIQLFYATGSIYEWSDSAPDGYKHATFSNGDEVQSSASVAQATASDPWSVDVAEKTGGAGIVEPSAVSATSGVSAISVASGTASASAGVNNGGSDTISSTSDEGSTGSHTGSSAKPSGTNGTSNGTADRNSSSGALPLVIAGSGVMGLPTLVGMVFGVGVAVVGGVFTGL